MLSSLSANSCACSRFFIFCFFVFLLLCFFAFLFSSFLLFYFSSFCSFTFLLSAFLLSSLLLFCFLYFLSDTLLSGIFHFILSICVSHMFKNHLYKNARHSLREICSINLSKSALVVILKLASSPGNIAMSIPASTAGSVEPLMFHISSGRSLRLAS